MMSNKTGTLVNVIGNKTVRPGQQAFMTVHYDQAHPIRPTKLPNDYRHKTSCFRLGLRRRTYC